MGELDWNAEAEAMAGYVAGNLADRRRGAIPGRQTRVSVVFGNDPGPDAVAAQDDVARIRDILDQEGIRMLGFGVAPGDGETWAMLVESEDVELLEELLRELTD